MKSEEVLKRLEDSMVSLDYDQVVEGSKEILETGIDPTDAARALTSGIRKVGEKYEKGEYFLSELLMAGEIINAGMEILSPALKGAGERRLAKVVICTVKGDLHDIGKNLAKMLLASEGFDVFDLGVDVDAMKIVEKVRESGTQIVGLSALLSTTIPYIGDVTHALKEARIRDSLKVIAGGAALDENTATRFGADAYAADAVKGARICVEWEGKR